MSDASNKANGLAGIALLIQVSILQLLSLSLFSLWLYSLSSRDSRTRQFILEISFSFFPDSFLVIATPQTNGWNAWSSETLSWLVHLQYLWSSFMSRTHLLWVVFFSWYACRFFESIISRQANVKIISHLQSWIFWIMMCLTSCLSLLFFDLFVIHSVNSTGCLGIYHSCSSLPCLSFASHWYSVGKLIKQRITNPHISCPSYSLQRLVTLNLYLLLSCPLIPCLSNDDDDKKTGNILLFPSYSASVSSGGWLYLCLCKISLVSILVSAWHLHSSKYWYK